MLPILALLVLSSPILAQEAEVSSQSDGLQDQGILSEKEERRVEKLEAAILADKPGDIVRTLKSTSRIDHPRVIEAIATGLNNPILGVQSASVEALRFQPNPDALDSLHKMYSRKKLLRENPALVAQLLRATGQRADESSLASLSAGGFRQDSNEVLRARIFAIGNLPGKDAVAALLLGMNTTPARQRILHMDAFRLALVKQTGADWGTDHEAWTDWWNENKRSITLPDEDDSLPRYLQQEWDAYWETTSVLPIVLPEPAAPQEEPAPAIQPGARKPKSGPAAAPNGRPIEANAGQPAKGAGAKQAGAKKPYRRPGKEGTPPKGTADPEGSRQGKTKGVEKPVQDDSPISGPPGESEKPDTPKAKSASETAERTRGISAPKWAVDDLN